MREYEIAHQSAGVVDRSTRGTLLVAGADRASFLQGLLTNDIKALRPGHGCYAAWLTPQGRMITDMRVIELGDRILLDVRASDAAALAQRLAQLVFAEDVQVQNEGDALDHVGVIGPTAATTAAAAIAVLSGRAAAVSGPDLAQWIEYQNAVFPLAGAELIVVRDDGLGVPGYDIYVREGRDLGPQRGSRAGGPSGARVRDALEQAGAARLDHPTTEMLRVEAGRPLFGVDMDTDTIPLEAGIEDRAISFSKGCYVGQEIIVRVVSRGHGRVARKLVGLVLDGTRVPAPGEPLFVDNRDVGRVTSAVRSPALGRPIALGYVHREEAEVGRRVTVGGGSRETATVTRLPFVSFVPRQPAAQ